MILLLIYMLIAVLTFVVSWYCLGRKMGLGATDATLGSLAFGVFWPVVLVFILFDWDEE